VENIISLKIRGKYVLSSHNIRLLATDLDGTILDSGGNIPERNRAAITEAIKKGIIVTISTGLMYSSAITFASKLGLRAAPLICYNGAMIRDMDGRTSLHIKLDMKVAREMLAIFRERKMYVQSYIDDALYIKNLDDDAAQMYTRLFGVTGHPIGDAIYAPEISPTKLLTVTSSADAAHALIDEFSEKFKRQAYVTTSNEDFVEMMSPEAGKANCLEKLTETLGMSMENVMALGDGENDTDMIQRAGIGIAMANAGENTKAAADDIAPSNDDCGVAWAVEKYILGA
jgi:Cof subfamily protein (haloacid dehalogenase superfamily)